MYPTVSVIQIELKSKNSKAFYLNYFDTQGIKFNELHHYQTTIPIIKFYSAQKSQKKF